MNIRRFLPVMRLAIYPQIRYKSRDLGRATTSSADPSTRSTKSAGSRGIGNQQIKRIDANSDFVHLGCARLIRCTTIDSARAGRVSQLSCQEMLAGRVSSELTELHGGARADPSRCLHR